MDKHYTYEELRKLIHSPIPLSDEVLEHIAVCERCSEMFFEISQETPVIPVRNAAVNIVERVAIKKQRMRDMIYNARVVFGVVVSIIMLFQTPLPNPHAETDIIKKNQEQMVIMEEKKEEFGEDLKEGFDKFIENYMKGQINHDETEE